ncbi:hypothetical protein GLAREA_10108 [Glarea lozoyensis ATCC 20868]|uniref:Uncharacterized protein n=1 Tax=Glarea lozoyensis (strain ATCC 20868 / MF5171) TaxID=1116229 RepID=S3DBD1_GLAL2|nr:uncharacterized protein GLAREA_10108 [Glarea lozoyensis ATCC 20868]EPE34414.1 hypothetical protein GLAREA_10108 [Glarea lozoyensis ATCC 20868]
MDASEDPQYSASDYPEITKSLVIAATTSSNVSWVSSAIKSTNWKPYIYITDSADAQLTVPINRGNEAMVYLTYIIQNYVDSLPDIMFFHHHHENAWHQLLTASHEITYLKDQFVMDSGYVSPRCLGSCENVIELSGNYIPLSDLEDAIPRETQIGSFLMEFLGWIPEKIASPCCAQFAVSREAVYRRSLDEWKSIRKWLEETKLSSSSSGRVLEHTWHILFGMESIHCPVQNVCLCGGFGMDCT